jgi:hypothetical protein
VELVERAAEERREHVTVLGALEVRDAAVGVLHQDELQTLLALTGGGRRLREEQQLLQHDRRHAAGGGAHDRGVAQPQTEHLRGIDTRIGAGHDARPQPRGQRQRLVCLRGEAPVALQEQVDRSGRVGVGELSGCVGHGVRPFAMPRVWCLDQPTVDAGMRCDPSTTVRDNASRNCRRPGLL